MVVLELASRRPKEAGLKCKRVDELEVLPHDHAPTALTVLLDSEVAAVEVKNIGVLREK